jgi:hypothetical protein
MNPIEEEKELNYVDIEQTVVFDENADSTSEDEDEQLKSIRQCCSSTKPQLIKRNESYNNFLTRSQRLQILGKDKPPSPDELFKRKVRFLEENMEIVHEIPHVAFQDKRKIWLSSIDFDRQENEIKVTCFRWKNHIKGSITFDEDKYSVRGIEHLIHKRTENVKLKHNRAVLNEINRQKLKHGKVVDWHLVRKSSEKYSIDDLKRAANVGKADEEAFLRAWNPEKYKKIDEKEAKQTNKKKKKGFLLWK